MKTVHVNLQKVLNLDEFKKRVLRALEILDNEQEKRFNGADSHVDSQLYSGFMNDKDVRVMNHIRSAKPEDLADFVGQVNDVRLKKMLPLFKARNFPRKLTAQERADWEVYKSERLFSGGPESRLAKYFNRIEAIRTQSDLTASQKNILEDLLLYGQSVMPSDIED